jgi:hypothetical protein
MRQSLRVLIMLASGLLLPSARPAAPQTERPQGGAGQIASRDDVVFLTNGDRITGKVLSSGQRNFVVQTPYGRLTIPRAQIDKVRHPDGTEDAGRTATMDSAIPRQRARLILIVLGKLFWQAWEPRDVSDPTLRLEVRLDDEVLGTYVDSRPDAEEIPRAVVNSFSFLADQVGLDPGPGTTMLPPEARPGRIALKMDVPVPPKGRHQLHLVYQVNGGTVSEPDWKDVVEASAPCELRLREPTFVRVTQDGGKMEFSGFSKRKMKFVETFRLALSAERSDGGS